MQSTSGAQMRKERKIWLIAICVRLASAFGIATFFQPDEYYQSLEPAWQLAFGQNSGAWLTWEWDNQLRSSLHPMLIAGVYYVVAVVGWALSLSLSLRTQLLLFTPRVFHALFAAAMDYCTWRLGEIVFGIASIQADAALVLSLFSPWQWFVGTRSLTNSLEASVTAVSLVQFPWSWIMQPQSSNKRKEDTQRIKCCVLLAATAAILRPTNIIIWAVLTLSLFFSATQQEILIFSQELTLYGTGVLVASSGLDRLYYGTWTFPAGTFLYFNLSQDLAVFYGRNRLDYYLTEGLPILLTTALPFAVAGIVQAFMPSSSSSNAPANSITTEQSSHLSHEKSKRQSASPAKPKPVLRVLALAALFYPLTLSAISHKEVRFLHPILPLFIVLAAGPVTTFFHPVRRSASTSKSLILAGLVLLTLSFMEYISNVHQRAPLAVLAYLRDEFAVLNADALMHGTQEYSTPLTSFFGHASLLSLLAHLLQHTKRDTTKIDPYRRLHHPAPPLAPLTAAFLTPCHSTPWRSHLIYPEIHAWALTCEPPLNVPLSERDTYLDEADVFYADPARWLRENMDASTLPLVGRGWVDKGWDRERLLSIDMTKTFTNTSRIRRPWPRYLIMYEQLELLIREFLDDEVTRMRDDRGDVGADARANSDPEPYEINYDICWRGFNTHWHDDWRRKGGMVVLCVRGESAGGVNQDGMKGVE